MLHSVLLIIHFICAFAIVGLVLLQRGKGAEAGAGFGAGASGTVFGARGASTALSRATGILAVLFMLTSLSLTYVGSHRVAPSGSSILDQLSQKQAPAVPAVPVNSVPSSMPSSMPSQPSGAETPAASGAPAAPAAAVPSGSAPPVDK